MNGLVIPAPAAGRLSNPGVLFFALAAATPMAVVALGVPAAYAEGLLVVPLIFAVAGVILLIFSSGYGAMSRRAPNAGAIYAMVARGLGRPLGLGAACIALLSYNALQLALYGLVARYAIGLSWWQAVIAAWVVVAVLGLCRPAVVSRLLTVLVLAEIVVITGFALADVRDPSGGHLLAPAWTLPRLDLPALGLLLVAAALAFVGFETTTAYAEEVGTVRRVTGLAVLILAALYTGAAWALQVAVGDDVTGVAAARGPTLIFDVAAARLTPWMVTLGRTVLLTGLLAGLIALHHTIKRYVIALGRDHVLPPGLSRPAAASTLQTVLAGLLLTAAWYFGLSPDSRAIPALQVSGGIGVLVLLTATSLATLLYLNRVPNGENAWQRLIAPGLATVAFGALSYLAFANLSTLLPVTGRDVWILPAALLAATIVGITLGLIMRAARPVEYAAIGLAGTAVVVSPTSPSVPDERTPGAHRPERVNPKLTA